MIKTDGISQKKLERLLSHIGKMEKQIGPVNKFIRRNTGGTRCPIMYWAPRKDKQGYVYTETTSYGVIIYRMGWGQNTYEIFTGADSEWWGSLTYKQILAILNWLKTKPWKKVEGKGNATH